MGSPEELSCCRSRLVFGLRRERVLVSADTDFGTLLATRRERSPSVICSATARSDGRSPQAETLLSNLEVVEADLTAGSVMVIEPSRIRVRSLPLVS
jgi:predicted nuclease of predicted toxin-antitoxin system